MDAEGLSDWLWSRSSLPVIDVVVVFKRVPSAAVVPFKRLEGLFSVANEGGLFHLMLKAPWPPDCDTSSSKRIHAFKVERMAVTRERFLAQNGGRRHRVGASELLSIPFDGAYEAGQSQLEQRAMTGLTALTSSDAPTLAGCVEPAAINSWTSHLPDIEPMARYFSAHRFVSEYNDNLGGPHLLCIGITAFLVERARAVEVVQGYPSGEWSCASEETLRTLAT